MNHLFLSGSNGQLGKCFVNKFSENGWLTSGLDIDKSSVNDNLESYVEGSVTSRSSWESIFATMSISSRLEDSNHFCLINNAGVAVFTPSEERTHDEFTDVVNINLLGPIFGTTEFYKFIKTRKLHRSRSNTFTVLNICSVYGHISPNPSIYTDTARNSSEIYGASKAGLAQMTRYFSVRYSSIPIRVNAISPGGVENKLLQGEDFISNYSNLVPLGRLCQANEVADLAHAMVNSPDYFTGQVLMLDGGMSSW